MVETIYLYQDGYKIDPETGEVLEFNAPPEFQVNDVEAFEWVMQKWQHEESEIVALEARKQAIIDNIDAMVRTHKQKVQSLKFRFENELAEFARNNMPKSKKTFTTPYGSVAFRSTPEKLEATNEELALAWAKQHCEQAVKVTEKFLISMVPDSTKSKLMANETDAILNGFQIKPAGETFTVKTGI